jgi:RimJ/RimL family protein N-acetyltransferase
MKISKAMMEDLDFLVMLRNEDANVRFSKRGTLLPEVIRKDYFENPDKHVFVVYMKDNRVGYLIFTDLGDTRFEISVAVSPEFRGKGLGHLIVKEGTSFGFRELGAKTIVAEIYPANIASLKIFQSQGYGLTDDSKEPWEFQCIT